MISSDGTNEDTLGSDKQSNFSVETYEEENVGADPDLPENGLGSMGVTEDEISNLAVLAYSIGHFYNDLCAALWFSYIVLFYERIVKFSKVQAGYLFFIGQVTDALATPIVGWGSDRIPLPRILRRYGRRKTCHIFGTFCVTISFPFIFNESYLTKGIDTVALLYYAFFIMIFQLGWASVQISHLSLIPELTNSNNQRTTLNSLRYVFTVIASVLTYGLIYSFINCEGAAHVSRKDLISYRNVDWIVVGVGLVFTVFFHLGTKESRSCSRWQESLSRSISVPSSPTRENAPVQHVALPSLKKMYWTDWLKEHQFYQIALLYMCSRLYINISQVYFPFYIQYTQGFGKCFVAVFPTVVCVTAFFVSSVISLRKVNQYLERKATYLLGCLAGIGCCVWLNFYNLEYLMFGASIVMGIAQAIVLVYSLAITADLIGRNTESGAFVYGAMSFVDKLSNGATTQVIQFLNEHANCSKSEGGGLHCKHYYRDVMVYVPGAAIALAVVAMISLLPQKLGQRNGDSTKKAVDILTVQSSESRNTLIG